MAFEKVTVIPVKSSGTIREMPSGVELDLRFSKSLSQSPFRRFILGLSQFYSENNINESKQLFKKPEKTIYAWYKLMNTIYYANLLDKYLRDVLIPEQEKPVVLYSYWGSFHTVSFMKLKKANLNVITSCRLHGSDLFEYAASGKYFPFRPDDLMAVDKITTVSQSGLDYLKNTYRIEFANASVHQLGVPDQSNRNPDPVKGNQYQFVSCSNLVEVKRVHLIIEALRILHLMNVNFKWTHFGDGPLMNKLKKLAARELPEKKVDFRGQTSNREVMEFYHHIPVNLFINTSRSEGIPVSIMEAFSMGIPSIAPSVGGVPEIIKHMLNGYLLNAKPKPAEIADAILTVVKNSNYSSMRINAYQTWKNNYRAETNFQAFAEMLAGLT